MSEGCWEGVFVATVVVNATDLLISDYIEFPLIIKSRNTHSNLIKKLCNTENIFCRSIWDRHTRSNRTESDYQCSFLEYWLFRIFCQCWRNIIRTCTLHNTAIFFIIRKTATFRSTLLYFIHHFFKLLFLIWDTIRSCS